MGICSHYMPTLKNQSVKTVAKSTKKKIPKAKSLKTPRLKSTLSENDWLKAAENAVAEGGFNEARVLPLSKALGVTRGSFYWHFKDHEEFIKKFIERWEVAQIQSIDLWFEEHHDPFQATERMLDIVLSNQVFSRKIFKIELAIRNFGSRDQVISEALQRIDEARRMKLIPVLRKLTDSDEHAQTLSYQVYLQTIGAQLMLNSVESGSLIKKQIKDSITQVLLSEQSRTL